jgi:hypothetical protein
MINTSATLPTFNKLLNIENSGTNMAESPFTLVLSGGKCICCGKPTQTQLAGHWTHPECAQYVAQLIRFAEVEIPALRIQVLCSNREYLEGGLVSLGQDNKRFREIQQKVEEEAWALFKKRHPMPWLNVKEEIKEAK